MICPYRYTIYINHIPSPIALFCFPVHWSPSSFQVAPFLLSYPPPSFPKFRFCNVYLFESVLFLFTWWSLGSCFCSTKGISFFYLFNVCTCMCVCMCMCAGVFRDQKGELDVMELELQPVVSCLTWILWTLSLSHLSSLSFILLKAEGNSIVQLSWGISFLFPYWFIYLHFILLVWVFWLYGYK